MFALHLEHRVARWRDRVDSLTKRARYTLYVLDALPIDLFCTVAALLWGAWLCLPLDTFRSNTSYAAMAAIAPEWAWGSTLVTVALLHVVGIFGELRGVRRTTSTALALLWQTIAVSFALANPRGTYILYPLLAAASLWVAVRVER